MITVEGRPGLELRVGGGEKCPRVVVASGDSAAAFDLVLAGDCGMLGDYALKAVASFALLASDGMPPGLSG